MSRDPHTDAARAQLLIRWVRAILTVVLLVVIWEGVGRIDPASQRLFPTPARTFRAFTEMSRTGEWLADVRASLFRYGLGFMIGWVGGVAVGLLTGRVPFLRDSLGLVMNLFRCTPAVALVPFALIWLGIGEQAKVAVVAWGVLFPVWLNTHAGVAEVEREYVWAAQSLGAFGWRLFREVYLPRALPFVLAGTRVAVATGFFALAAAEMVGAHQGVAMRIFHSQQVFRTDKMLVAVLTIGMLGVVGDRLFLVLARSLFPWWRGGRDVAR